MERTDQRVSSRGDEGDDNQERWVRGDRLQRGPPERRGGRRQGFVQEEWYGLLKVNEGNFMVVYSWLLMSVILMT